jgi:hypothetical protein
LASSSSSKTASASPATVTTRSPLGWFGPLMRQPGDVDVQPPPVSPGGRSTSKATTDSRAAPYNWAPSWVRTMTVVVQRVDHGKGAGVHAQAAQGLPGQQAHLLACQDLTTVRSISIWSSSARSPAPATVESPGFPAEHPRPIPSTTLQWCRQVSGQRTGRRAACLRTFGPWPSRPIPPSSGHGRQSLGRRGRRLRAPRPG